MAVFSQRRKGYKIGFVFLLLSVVMATWGVIAPGWLRSDVDDGQPAMYFDLWFEDCHHDFTGCQTAQFKDASLLTTMGLGCVGLLMLLCCCVILVRVNFCLSLPSYSRAPEVLAILAGLTLFIGCMTYVGDNADFLNDFPTLHWGPSFILTLTSSLLASLGGVLLSVYNKRPGTSYYSRFRPISFVSSSEATMVEATATTLPTTASSIQRQDEYPVKAGYPQGGLGYGYGLQGREHNGVVQYGAINGLYEGQRSEVVMHEESYENSPLFR